MPSMRFDNFSSVPKPFIGDLYTFIDLPQSKVCVMRYVLYLLNTGKAQRTLIRNYYNAN